MKIPRTVMATAAVVSTLVGMSVTGCSSHPKSSTPSSGSGAATHAPISDYTQLLIKASDINAPVSADAGLGARTHRYLQADNAIIRQGREHVGQRQPRLASWANSIGGMPKTLSISMPRRSMPARPLSRPPWRGRHRPG
jgi:hypothetical protein